MLSYKFSICGLGMFVHCLPKIFVACIESISIGIFAHSRHFWLFGCAKNWAGAKNAEKPTETLATQDKKFGSLVIQQ